MSEDMDLVLSGVTVARRDAGAEPTRTYLRRVTEMSTEFMSITELLRSKVTVAIWLNVDSIELWDSSGLLRYFGNAKNLF